MSKSIISFGFEEIFTSIDFGLSISVSKNDNGSYIYAESVNDLYTEYEASTLEALHESVSHMLIASSVVKAAMDKESPA